MTPPEIPGRGATGSGDELDIGPEEVGNEEVLALLEAQLTFARSVTPPEHVHAVEPGGLQHVGLLFFGARRRGALVGIGALQRLDAEHVELKSMHTLAGARGRGVGQAMVDHLLRVARERGYRRVSLETGRQAEFATARRLYQRAGFEPCGPFGTYTDTVVSTYLTMTLDP